MRRCPQCGRTFTDDMAYCLDDGTPLEIDPASVPTVVIRPPGTAASIGTGRGPGAFVFALVGGLVVLVVGLGVLVYYLANKPNTENGTPQNSSPSGSAQSSPVKNANVAVTEPTPAPASVDDARTVFSKWLAAQNDHDSSGYRACYSPTMIGVKRTPEGARQEFSYARWIADRTAMMRRIVSVSAEGETFTTEGDAAVVRFTQYWRSVNHCDIGDKELRIKRTGDGPKIVFETLENPRDCR